MDRQSGGVRVQANRGDPILLLERCLKGAYINKSRTGIRPSWKSITGTVDKFVFRDVDIEDQEATKVAYKRSLSYIDSIKKSWFDPLFLTESYDGLCDMKLGMIVGEHSLLHDTVDLILFDEKDVIICQVTDVDDPVSTLYNDIRLRGQALMLSRELGKNVNKIRRITWKKETAITVKDIHIHHPEEFNRKTEIAISQMVEGIRNEVFYTSVNTQCLTCPFRKICSM